MLLVPVVVVQLYSRGDLGLHEDEDEDQEGRQHAGEHHPDGEGLDHPQWVDEPAPLVRTGDRETTGDTQFLQGGEGWRRREWDGRTEKEGQRKREMDRVREKGKPSRRRKNHGVTLRSSM